MFTLCSLAAALAPRIALTPATRLAPARLTAAAARGGALPTALRGVCRTSARCVVRMADAKEEDKEEDKLGAGGRGGHQVRGAPQLSPEEQKVQSAVMEHQQGAARLSQAEDARSLVGYSSGYAVLSTLSKALDGYPSGSLVGFAIDDAGLPIFCFSAMSSHTQDLMRDPKGEFFVIFCNSLS